ncbi:MAG: TIM barrel protein [Steroidobacteraceae bacterium]
MDHAHAALASDRLGVQAHCLRHEIAAGLEPALARVAALGIGAIEMMSFPGCRGQAWGDFGAAADRAPRDIGAALRAAGLACPSTMVLERELDLAHIEATLHWVNELGCPRLVQSSFAIADDAGAADWQLAFDRIEGLARRVRAAGLRYVLHTQINLWRPLGARRPIDLLLERIDPELMQLDYDPSGTIDYGLDPAGPLRARPDAFYALHLRDAHTPPEPVFYLAALPLGTGGVDWPALLDAARASAIEYGFLEMEVAEPARTFAALESSRRYLLERGLLAARP